MGTRHLDAAPSALADALFTPVQQRVLAPLFGQPRRRFQSSEVIELAASGTGATHRVLKRLAEVGLVIETTVGRQKFYQANESSPIFADLVSLIRKTVGLVGPLQESLGPLQDKINAAFVYGSVAQGTDDSESDIDLMIVGEELEYATVFEALQEAEGLLGRPVNPTLLTPEAWREKSQQDGFVARVRDSPRIWIVGTEDEL